MRYLALDLGTKRVGVAVGDEISGLATPRKVWENGHDERMLTEAVIDAVEEEGSTHLVVGLPLNMDGTVGGAARRAVELGLRLALAANVPPIFVDERLSSFDAEQQLIERKRAGEKLTRDRKRAQLDAIAAAGFLQNMLNGEAQSLNAGEAVALVRGVREGDEP